MGEIIEVNLHKDVVKAYAIAEKLKETYRFEEGKRLFEEMMTDKHVPDVFIKMCMMRGVNYVSFEKETVSEDYMPDSGWYIILNGGDNDPLKFMYEHTELFMDDVNFFGADGIHCPSDIESVLEENEIILSSEEAADLFGFVTGYGKEGARRDLYDITGSAWS